MLDNRGNFIHPTAIIGDNVEYGSGNYFGPYCIIGEVAEHKTFLDIEKGQVIIGDNNRFFGAATIDAGTSSKTVIGNNGFFMKRVHIGHDAVIGDGVTISVGAVIGGHAIIMEGANIGLNATIHQNHVIGAYAMIGMNSCVPLKREVLPCHTYAGNPITCLGWNKHAIQKHSISEIMIDEFNLNHKKAKNGIHTTTHY